MATTGPNPVIEPTVTSSARELVISHCYADGTLLTGTRREDDLYSLLRSLGWLYRRSCGDFRLQGSVDKPAKTGAIDRTVTALRDRGFLVRVEVDNSVRPVADAEADLADAADTRADRLHGRARRLRREAQARDAAGHQVLDNIPLGQPYLTDTAGYRADRRRRERAVDNLARAAELDRRAEDTQRAAQTAAARVEHRHHPETVANRIHQLEADHRAVGRRLANGDRFAELLASGTPREEIPWTLTELTPEHRQKLVDRQAHLDAQLAHWRQVRQQQIDTGLTPNYGRDQIHRGDLIQYRSTWYLVLRTNPTTVTVPSPLGASTWTVRYERITDHVPADSDRWTATAAAAVEAAYRFAGGCGPHAAMKALADTLGQLQ